MADVLVEQAPQPPRFRITVSGKAFPDGAVLSIVVRRSASQPAQLQLGCTAENGHEFPLGAELHLTVNDVPLFTGAIARVSDQRDGEQRETAVVAEDSLASLRHVTVSQVFHKKKASEIVTEVLASASLKARMPATKEVREQYVAAGQPAYDLCLQLAAEHGLFFHVAPDGKTVIFTPADDEKAGVVLTAKAGQNLIRFSGSERVVPSNLSMRSWSVAEQTLVEAHATVGGKGASAVRDCARQSYTEVEELAKGVAAELKGMRFAGSGTVPGHPSLDVGTRIHVQESGEYLVTACEHRIEDGDYVTNFSVGLTEPLPRPPRGAPPLLPAVVSKTFGDPEGWGRIQVALVTIGSTETVWAHAALPFSGFHFVHEVADQVMVSFLQDEPSLPVVAGVIPSMKMHARAPQKPADGKRGVGQIVHGKSSLQLAAGDDGPAAASLEIPTLKVQVIEDAEKGTKDPQQKASVVLAPDGIDLVAGASKVTVGSLSLVAASKALQVSAEEALSLRGTTVTVKGATVSINDDALKVV